MSDLQPGVCARALDTTRSERRHVVSGGARRDHQSSARHDARRAQPNAQHSVVVRDCVDLLRSLPDDSMQVIVCDPLNNVQMVRWDSPTDYIRWAAHWVSEAAHMLRPAGVWVANS